MPDGPGHPARLTRFGCGATHHDLAGLFRGAARERRTFPSAAYLFDDGAGRRVLFDTGYAAAPWDAGLAGALYRRLLPPQIGPGETIGARLSAAGIDPASVTDIVLSHAHPDHIGGVASFPQARILLSEGVARTLRAPRLREGVLAGLLPDWFDLRVRTVPDADFTPVEVAGVPLAVADPWGDGAYRLVRLPGHARGHLGALVDGRVLLAGDAAWAAEFLPRARDLRVLPRFIQHDPDAYAATADALTALAEGGVRLCFSHDPGDDAVLLDG
ncbi:MBL fold metallo-hydrolase [Propioniciclava coleopterorum]|uniref:MBL fold metallo-hydrolase n=1 Tax=Propioniciclava coleopterorum TaxID=2714937 RepID=A0A6G7Y5C1_9ACTN|nr:MBL fold metallo-hydrolase [Propioniciclava coleopterorum]QIK71909.1 MBL fold metallo-hydrolase [Propioniciclava coleopterorum]